MLDEQRRQQLHEQAARLDPDSWVTDDEVRRSLEEYEAVLASLRDVVGRRRRRRRTGASPAEQPGPQSAPHENDENDEDPQASGDAEPRDS